MRETPVEDLGLTLPSLLLPLWDSELGSGFIATLRSLLAGNEVSLIRSFLQEVITVEVGPTRRQSARFRADPRAVRRVTAGGRRDGALHPGTGSVQVAARATDRRDHRAESAALPHRRPARADLISRPACRGHQPLMLGVVADGRWPRRPAAPGRRRRSGRRGAAAGCRADRRRATRVRGPPGTPGCRAAVRRARGLRAERDVDAGGWHQEQRSLGMTVGLLWLMPMVAGACAPARPRILVLVWKAKVLLESRDQWRLVRTLVQRSHEWPACSSSTGRSPGNEAS